MYSEKATEWAAKLVLCFLWYVHLDSLISTSLCIILNFINNFVPTYCRTMGIALNIEVLLHISEDPGQLLHIPLALATAGLTEAITSTVDVQQSSTPLPLATSCVCFPIQSASSLELTPSSSISTEENVAVTQSETFSNFTEDIEPTSVSLLPTLLSIEPTTVVTSASLDFSSVSSTTEVTTTSLLASVSPTPAITGDHTQNALIVYMQYTNYSTLK